LGNAISIIQFEEIAFYLQQKAPSQIKEKNMKPIGMPLALAILLAIAGLPTYSQGRSYSPNQPTQSESNASPSGTRFLAGLQDILSTKDDKAGKEFKVTTLEPVTTADGRIIPPGAEIRGHIDKVEAAHQTGRGRMWLTFDDIKTPNGWAPIVAVVSDIPGVHSVKVDYEREGEIEARSSKQQEEAEAAAAGAFVGATSGVVNHNAKSAAIGAAAGAATAFMVASGIGQDVTLDKKTKLELTLDRPLYVGGN
jgi:hypothetical protein